MVIVVDDEGNMGALVATTEGITASDETTADALVDSTGGTSAGASERAGIAEKSTGGAGALVVTSVGSRRMDSSVDSVTRGFDTDGKLEGPYSASAKSGELLPE